MKRPNYHEELVIIAQSFQFFLFNRFNCCLAQITHWPDLNCAMVVLDQKTEGWKAHDLWTVPIKEYRPEMGEKAGTQALILRTQPYVFFQKLLGTCGVGSSP